MAIVRARALFGWAVAHGAGKGPRVGGLEVVIADQRQRVLVIFVLTELRQLLSGAAKHLQ